jgi:DNA primase
VHGDKRGEGLRISDRSIEQVREAANIVEVASEFTALRRQGTRFIGLCPYPEHSEKTPSFSVSQDRGFYYCFGCQRGGDAIKLVSELKSFSFVDAVAYLAERSGVEIEFEGGGDPEAARERNLRRRNIHKALAAAAVYYHKYLLKARSSEAEHARRYLKGRGLERSTIEEFRLGYAPPRGVGGFAGAAARLGIERKTLDAAGLLSAGGRERFAGRITFPISDRRGRIVGFGARSLGDDHPKYLNSPETEIFNKRDLLYGFPQVSEAMRKERVAIIVEGYTDVLMLYQSGIKNAVATLGTATTPSHLRILSGYADKIYMLFDPDTAGEKALERADATVRELERADDPDTVATATRLKLDLRVLRLTEDPADWLLEHSPEEFAEMLSGAVTLLEYIFRRKVERARGASAAERSRMMSEVRGLIRRIDDPVFYREALRVAAEAMGVNPQELESGRRERSVRATSSQHAASTSPLEQAGQLVLALLLAHPDLTAKPLERGVRVPPLLEPFKLDAKDFAIESQSSIFHLLQKHPGENLESILADERARALMDQLVALGTEAEEIRRNGLYSSEASVREAFLRLGILSRQRSKNETADYDRKEALHSETQALKEALRAVSVEP